MNLLEIVWIVVAVLAFWVGRAHYYKQVFGRWVWFRLTDKERERIIPSDSRSAYRKGYKEGYEAALEQKESPE